MSKFHRRKYTKIFLDTVESDIEYCGEIDKLNILNTKPEDLHKINTNHVAMFKYLYENHESVVMIFCLPINSDKETSTSKSVAERVMTIIKDSEICFTCLDFSTSQSDTGFIYLKMIKKYDDLTIKLMKEKQKEDDKLMKEEKKNKEEEK